MFLTIAMSLAVFNISKGRSEFGQIIEPSLDYQPGIINHPNPFRCTITPRSPKAASLIETIDEDHVWKSDDPEILRNVKW